MTLDYQRSRSCTGNAQGIIGSCS